MTTTKAYDALNRLTSTSTSTTGGASSASPISAFSYADNPGNQRTRSTLMESLSAVANAGTTLYGYDGNGNVAGMVNVATGASAGMEMFAGELQKETWRLCLKNFDNAWNGKDNLVWIPPSVFETSVQYLSGSDPNPFGWQLPAALQ